jgi:DNA ligase-associated metallophosphoesterase
MSSLDIEIKGQHLVLLAQRAVFWPAERALIVSDVHAGKAAHFRKAGLAVPRSAFEADLARLDALVQAWAPRQVIATGDLFHSVLNREVEAFGRWRQQYTETAFELVRGNHDVLADAHYAAFGLAVHTRLALGPLAFRHHPPPAGDIEPLYCLTGHLHPGYRLSGPARQQLQLPCFYFTTRYAVLPAFSRLTGLAFVQPRPGDRLFVIVGEERVMAV